MGFALAARQTWRSQLRSHREMAGHQQLSTLPHPDLSIRFIALSCDDLITVWFATAPGRFENSASSGRLLNFQPLIAKTDSTPTAIAISRRTAPRMISGSAINQAPLRCPPLDSLANGNAIRVPHSENLISSRDDSAS